MTYDLRLVDMQLAAKKIGKDVATVVAGIRSMAGQAYATKNAFHTLAADLTACAGYLERIAHDPDGLIEEIAEVEGWCDQLQNFRNFLVSEGSGDDISPAKTSATISDVSGRQLQPSEQGGKHKVLGLGQTEKPEAKEVIMEDGNTRQPRKIGVRARDTEGWKELEHDWLPMMDGLMVAADCVCGKRVSHAMKWGKGLDWSEENWSEICAGCRTEVRFEWR